MKDRPHIIQSARGGPSHQGMSDRHTDIDRKKLCNSDDYVGSLCLPIIHVCKVYNYTCTCILIATDAVMKNLQQSTVFSAETLTL